MAIVFHSRLVPLGWAASAMLASLAVLPAYGENPYGVEEPSRLSLRALIDFRIIRSSEAPSWQDRGPGTLRYGGVTESDGSFGRVTRYAISQFALEPSAQLPWGIQAQAQLNWEGDIDDHGDSSPADNEIRLIEAFLRKDWGASTNGWALLGGAVNPAFSLEHTGPAWTPEFTLTPSALNSWLWQEGRIVGVEAEGWRTLESGVQLRGFTGLGWGPDHDGILLARRGWVLDDFLSGVNSDLPLPSPAGAETEIDDETDHRAAIYAGGSIADPRKIATLHLGYADNRGDISKQGVWSAHYSIAGIQLQPLPGLDLIVQFLTGEIESFTPGLRNKIQAIYPLVSYRWRQHRLSLRYDDFKVDDQDGSLNMPNTPNTQQDGSAWTFAYMLEMGLRHRIAAEYITVDSERHIVVNNSPVTVDQPDEAVQFSYRFRY